MRQSDCPHQMIGLLRGGDSQISHNHLRILHKRVAIQAILRRLAHPTQIAIWTEATSAKRRDCPHATTHEFARMNRLSKHQDQIDHRTEERLRAGLRPNLVQRLLYK